MNTETTKKSVKVTVMTQKSNKGDFCLSLLHAGMCMCTDVQAHVCMDVEARG